MAVTVSRLSGLSRLRSLGTQAGVPEAIAALETQSSAIDEVDSTDFLGELVAFIGARERLRVLGSWAEENTFADRLEVLGATAAADAELMRRIRIAGSERPVKSTFLGFVRTHYVVAMVAARPALADSKVADFIERLRVLLLIRSLEAAAAGHGREAHLGRVCEKVRQVCETSGGERLAWFSALTHEAEGFDDFVRETLHKAEVQKGTGTAERSHRQFLNALAAVLKRVWQGKDNPYQPSPTAAANRSSSLDWAALFRRPPQGSIGDLVFPQDEDQPVAQCVYVSPDRPPAAQRAQATGLQLQSLESSQYLRHSWHRLSTVEEAAVLDRCKTLLAAKAQIERVGAALTTISMLTSLGLDELGHMRISAQLSYDWQLDWERGELHRHPARFFRRWRAGASTVAWVSQQVEAWRIRLPRTVLQALRTSESDGASPVNLHEVWHRCAPTTKLESWFNAAFAFGEDLQRLTSPAVPLALAQQVFEHGSDHALARLVSSSSRTALPAACTYGAFSTHEVQAAMRRLPGMGIETLLTGEAKDANAAGSEMDVVLERLRQAIGELVEDVDAAVGDSACALEHHNRLTVFCVIALFASTGARPVRSPFEALTWIDFERCIIYIEDKHSGPSKGSRVCVLSDFARELLVEHYLPHLASLADALETTAPTFADDIRQVLSRGTECALPLFFLLRPEPFDWYDVSEAQLNVITQGRWPLPWNFFRHLHSTQLRRWGLHPDVRDALLSHGDRDAESHGDFSWRVPADDLETARPLINRLTQVLGFRLPRSRSAPAMSSLHVGRLAVDRPRTYGRKARKERREAVHDRAKAQAREDLIRAIGDRPPSSLSPDEWEEIGRSMLVRKGNLSHPMAELRYEVFENYLSDLWRDKGVQPRLSRRWVPPREGAALFGENVIDAPKQIDRWRNALKLVEQTGCSEQVEPTKKKQVRRRPGPVLAAWLAVLELALHCRVDNKTVLRSVLLNSPAIRLVRFCEQVWLECAYHVHWEDGRPVYRAPITARAASWLTLASDGAKTPKAVPAVPKALGGLMEDCVDHDELLERIATTVAMQNCLELPGALAAVLSGRQESSALPHRDWVRLTHGAALVEDDQTAAFDLSDSQHSEEDELDDFGASRRTASTAAGGPLERCRRLFKDVLQALGRSSGAKNARPAAQIEQAVRVSGFKSGDAPYVLAHYARHLLARPKKGRQGQSLQASTRVRYWYALAPGMLDFAFDVDLASLDDDEITELYANIVNAAQVPPATAARGRKAQHPSHAKRKTLRSDSDAPHRTSTELQAFHEFVRNKYGLEDPDWSAISTGSKVGSGRPGVVLMAEYRAALNSLAAAADVTALDDLTLASCFVLLTCARFGLRTGEAVGLQRQDWLQPAGSTVVLVRANSVRPLKTDRSRRQVPLIGSLDADETRIVAEVLRRHELNEAGQPSRPLLRGVAKSAFKSNKAEISSILLPLLKSVTRNPGAMVHHLRHSFACRVLGLLCDQNFDRDPCFEGGDASDSVRRLLLGASAADRRTLWSVARLLGHASPATTLKSYCHVVDRWLPFPPDRSPIFDVKPNVVDLDARPKAADYLTGPFRATPVIRPTESLFLRYMRYLRLLARKRPASAASAHLSSTELLALQRNFELAARKLAAYREDRRTLDGLLSGVPGTRWGGLIRLAENAPDCDAFDTTEWIGTIGANRQILLFMEKHFVWGSRFINCIGEEARSLLIVAPDELLPAIHEYRGRHLPEIDSVPKTKWTDGFQIDEATVGPLEVKHPHRVALIPKPSSSRVFGSTIELVLAWITWLTASSTDAVGA